MQPERVTIPQNAICTSLKHRGLHADVWHGDVGKLIPSSAAWGRVGALQSGWCASGWTSTLTLAWSVRHLSVERKEKFALFSDHNGSLLRRHPGAHLSVEEQLGWIRRYHDTCRNVHREVLRWFALNCHVLLQVHAKRE